MYIYIMYEHPDRQSLLTAQGPCCPSRESPCNYTIKHPKALVDVNNGGLNKLPVLFGGGVALLYF